MTRTRALVAAIVVLIAQLMLFQHASAHHRSGHNSGRDARSQEPTPSPSDSPSPGAEETAELQLALTAAASSVSVSEDLSWNALVENVGDDTAERVKLTIALPPQLEFTSSTPEAWEIAEAGKGEEVTFLLGDITSGSSQTVTLITTATKAKPTVVVTAIAQSGDETAEASATVTVEPAPGLPGLDVTARADFLVQVHDQINYAIEVVNESDQVMSDVVVIDLVPAEVDVVGVPLADGVDAVQIGEHAGQEDIVWVIGELPAGETMKLTWLGRASAPGDLEAANEVQVKVSNQLAGEAQHRTFLGVFDDASTDNPKTFKPITKRIVTFETPEGETAAAGILPATGVTPTSVVTLGVALIVTGIGLLAMSRMRARWSCIAAVMVLTLSACVGDEAERPPTAAPTTTASPTDGDEDQDDRVLGTRVRRGGRAGQEGGPGDEVAPPIEPPSPPVVSVPVEPVRRVEIVTLGLNELPVDQMESRAGDNALTYVWNSEESRIEQATSSIRFDPAATTSLTTTVFVDGDSIDAVVTLTNTSESERLAVKGRLLHRVFDGAELLTTLESEPIDTLLAPGGEVSASFSYLLSSGDYAAEAGFASE